MRDDLIQELQCAVQEITDPLFASFTTYRFDVGHNQLELHVQPGDDALKKALVLRVVVDHSGKRIGIPNILIPMDMKHQGHGKRIIAQIFEVATLRGYSLFIIDLVPSFHRRLLARGAVLVNNDTVQITDRTRLSG